MTFEDRDIPLAEATDVANCSCANLRKAMRMVTQMYDAALQPAGLKATQFTLLATLSRRGGLPLTQLAEILVMDRTTLTRNLKPLVAKGLIEDSNGTDQRERRIALTREGRSVLEQALPAWEAVQVRFVESLGHQRWAGFIGDLAAAVDAARRS
jgi:DNA-binding MarR family transcriptional regulator